MGTNKMNGEITYPDINNRDENADNENGLDDSAKSNGFLYVDISDYNENNLDGIEIKQEEEQVEDLTLEKNGIETDELYLEENLPLNSLKNLANQPPSKVRTQEICIKNKINVKKKGGFSNKSIQKENISVKRQVFNNCNENSDSKHYKLRARNWSQNIDLKLIENSVERKKKKKLSIHKKVYVCRQCGVIFSNKNKFLKHEIEKKNFECLKCRKFFCKGNLLDAHFKLCRHKKNIKNLRIGCKKYLDPVDSDNCTNIFYKCDTCKRSFIKKRKLVSHIEKNECTEIYTCAICEETFSKKNCLKKHIIAHMKSQLQCQYCFEILANRTLNNHNCSRETKNKIVLHECDPKIQLGKVERVNYNSIKCNKFSVSQESKDNQSTEAFCPTVYKCHICKKIYKGFFTYKKHLNGHRENGMTTDNHNVLSRSSEIASQINPGDCQRSSTGKRKFRYECDTCGRGFLKLVNLKIHILNIHQGINYQCEKCNAKFLNRDDYDSHMNNQSCKPEDLCKCKTCGKVFAKRDYLKKHQYMHMNVLFKCKYCYCAFMKEKSYKRHIEKMNCSKSARRIRMAEFNYKRCRLCEVEYETEELLLGHFRAVHIGLEPHQCFCCDSCLPTFQDLQNHIHQHNIQKYTCNLCGKPYTSQEGFRKHRLKHKGAEFKCKFCESEFLNESRFKFHEKTCKKNPESGYTPPVEKERSKKKDDKPKQSRQLHWESRIIMKRLRGDPKSLAGDQKSEDLHDSTVASTFFDEPETDTSDERGWFSNYYKTDEDDIAFGLKKPDESTPQDCDSDFDVSELLQAGSVDKKKKKPSSSPSSILNTANTNALEDRGEIDPGVGNDSSSSSEFSSSDSDKEVEDTNLPIDYNPKKCRLCVISFSQEYELLHHFIKSHPREYAHKCPQCEVQSPLYAQLKEHLKTHGIGIGIFNCDNCSKQFKSEKKMNNHNIRCKGINNKIGVGDKAFSQSGDDGCKRCGKVFHTKFGYRRHKQLCKKRKNKNKNSDKFSTVLVKSSKEDATTVNVEEGNDFQLSDAEDEEGEGEKVSRMNNQKLTPSKSQAVSNEKLNSTKSVADVNGSKPEAEEKKEEVKSSYTGEPPMDSFPCRLCDKKFQYERGIVMHFKSAHPGNKPLICHVCNMHLADKLKEHLKTHGIGEEFICELCGKRFNQKFLSKIHEMWHQGIEYKCNNCKQKFLNKEKMDKHIGENRCSNRQSLMRLPCDICGKSYRSKFGLSKHYITHTPKELRPVKNRMNCEYCGKWFEYNNGLQRHRRIHTGERPFCCRFCPKAFAQEGNCKAHERIHTGESKPRRKKLPAAPITPTITSNIPTSISSPQLPPPHLPPSSTVESISYPSHINLYIYNNIDPNGIVH